MSAVGLIDLLRPVYNACYSFLNQWVVCILNLQIKLPAVARKCFSVCFEQWINILASSNWTEEVFSSLFNLIQIWGELSLESKWNPPHFGLRIDSVWEVARLINCFDLWVTKLGEQRGNMLNKGYLDNRRFFRNCREHLFAKNLVFSQTGNLFHFVSQKQGLTIHWQLPYPWGPQIEVNVLKQIGEI